jgi:SAM-dependent methyltransferase
MTSSETSRYALGSTEAEHARLARQAAWLSPHTERLFRDAGIQSGARVLELGSGAGDVALIAAQLVGPSGTVVGIERDSRSVDWARARMAAAGNANVTLVRSDVGQFLTDELFDAAVGRYILMFVPDPASVLRSTARLVRPGGVLAFQEPDWTRFLEEAARLPLWSVGATLLVDTLQQCDTNTDMGKSLSRAFQEAGLPAPAVRTDCLIGSESWLPDCLRSLRPKMMELGLPFEELGDVDTLQDRLTGEVLAKKARTPLPSIVSAWSQKPATLAAAAER